MAEKVSNSTTQYEQARKFIFRRYGVFVLSLFINALGVAFITRALLGTSPITSVMYVLSMFTPYTMGQWTIALNILFVVLELFFMTKHQLKSDLRMYLLQIPVSLCFGFFIDISMNLLFWLEPSLYWLRLLSLLVGCIVLALGIALEVKADIAMTSGEYFVRVLAIRTKKEFGYVKLFFDITMVIIAITLSLLFMNSFKGVREGTVVAALIVGPIVHFVRPYYAVWDKWIGRKATCISSATTSASPIIITIAREYGSGGHLIGEALSQRLSIPLYDKEFIELAARRSGIDQAYIKRNEQRLPSYWIKWLMSSESESSIERSVSKEDILYVAECSIIKELAEKGSCIIVGRCADVVLKEYPHLLSVFCYTTASDARQRCMEVYKIPETVVDKEIQHINKMRKRHYEYYTGEQWGERTRYSLMLNTSEMRIEDAVKSIEILYLEKKKELNT